MEANIKTAIDNYIKQLQEFSDNDFKSNYPKLWEMKQHTTFVYDQGKRWVKVLKTAPGEKSAFCFIDPANGDIFKAAGYNAPAKGKRGNIFDKKLPLTLGALYR